MRTHFCGLVDEALVGQTVTLCGWADVARNLGGLCFIDLRDHEGIVQIVAEPGVSEADVLAELHRRLAGRPVYLSWDMDAFDPSCAPGVCTPIWGGFSAREGISFLRGLAGLNIVAADINTVSPPQDVMGMTAFLAAHVTYEIMLLLCAARLATVTR